jgi:hypothetical protein
MPAEIIYISYPVETPDPAHAGMTLPAQVFGGGGFMTWGKVTSGGRVSADVQADNMGAPSGVSLPGVGIDTDAPPDPTVALNAGDSLWAYRIRHVPFPAAGTFLWLVISDLANHVSSQVRFVPLRAFGVAKDKRETAEKKRE